MSSFLLIKERLKLNSLFRFYFGSETQLKLYLVWNWVLGWTMLYQGRVWYRTFVMTMITVVYNRKFFLSCVNCQALMEDWTAELVSLDNCKSANSRKQGTYWGDKSRTNGQEIYRLLWNLRVHYCVHRTPPLDPTQSNFDLVHIFTVHTMFLQVPCNILASTFRSPK
jgi:hypothetical protein